MDSAAAQASLGISPSVGGCDFSWIGDTLVCSPVQQFADTTRYTVTVAGTALDLSGRGLDGDGDGGSTGSPGDDYTFNFLVGLPCSTAVDCEDGNPCTTDVCNADSSCQNDALPDGSSCSDGDACNGPETCQAGFCAVSVPLVCDDGNPCTSGSRRAFLYGGQHKFNLGHVVPCLWRHRLYSCGLNRTHESTH